MKLRALLAVPFLAAVLLSESPAADWPQWRGPDRSGVSKETGLLKEWPKDGPKLVWKLDNIDDGFSTPSIAGDRIYLNSNKGGDEYTLCLSVADGKEIWKTKIGKVGQNKGPQYPGARSTPTVDGDRIYALASDGELVCLGADGKPVWTKHLRNDFGGKMGNWAYAESPLVDGDNVVCTPGGSTATMLCLNKKTGEAVWKCAVPGGDDAGYASIVIGSVGSSKEYIQLTGKGVIGVEAKTGKFLWRFDGTVGGRGPNIGTPVFHDGLVFTSTAGMGGGQGGVARIKVDGETVTAEKVWVSKEAGNHIGGFVRVGDHLYGTTNSALLCVEFASGKIVWQDKCVGKGSVAAADGMLYVRGESGAVALVEATPDGYKEKGRFTPDKKSSKPSWPYPVICNGRLYLRDGNYLYCYDVKAP
jgi:outer membrane protein assembly factor BamB